MRLLWFFFFLFDFSRWSPFYHAYYRFVSITRLWIVQKLVHISKFALTFGIKCKKINLYLWCWWFFFCHLKRSSEPGETNSTMNLEKHRNVTVSWIDFATQIGLYWEGMYPVGMPHPLVDDMTLMSPPSKLTSINVFVRWKSSSCWQMRPGT